VPGATLPLRSPLKSTILIFELARSWRQAMAGATHTRGAHMGIPGFRAEASLYETGRRYAMGRIVHQASGIVLQQLGIFHFCQGLSGCALFRCECLVTGGIYTPSSGWPPGHPCGFCIHE
jgi:hypothetical protein